LRIPALAPSESSNDGVIREINLNGVVEYFTQLVHIQLVLDESAIWLEQQSQRLENVQMLRDGERHDSFAQIHEDRFVSSSIPLAKRRKVMISKFK
jgi:hypothetical protein